MDLNEKQVDCFNKLSRFFALLSSRAQSGRGKRQKHKPKPTSPERAPADSRPFHLYRCCKKWFVEQTAWNSAGARSGLVGFDLCLDRWPPS